MKKSGLVLFMIAVLLLTSCKIADNTPSGETVSQTESVSHESTEPTTENTDTGENEPGDETGLLIGEYDTVEKAFPDAEIEQVMYADNDSQAKSSYIKRLSELDGVDTDTVLQFADVEDFAFEVNNGYINKVYCFGQLLNTAELGLGSGYNMNPWFAVSDDFAVLSPGTKEIITVYDGGYRTYTPTSLENDEDMLYNGIYISAQNGVVSYRLMTKELEKFEQSFQAMLLHFSSGNDETERAAEIGTIVYDGETCIFDTTDVYTYTEWAKSDMYNYVSFWTCAVYPKISYGAYLFDLFKCDTLKELYEAYFQNEKILTSEETPKCQAPVKSEQFITLIGEYASAQEAFSEYQTCVFNIHDVPDHIQGTPNWRSEYKEGKVPRVFAIIDDTYDIGLVLEYGKLVWDAGYNETGYRISQVYVNNKLYDVYDYLVYAQADLIRAARDEYYPDDTYFLKYTGNEYYIYEDLTFTADECYSANQRDLLRSEGIDRKPGQ